MGTFYTNPSPREAEHHLMGSPQRAQDSVIPVVKWDTLKWDFPLKECNIGWEVYPTGRDKTSQNPSLTIQVRI